MKGAENAQCSVINVSQYFRDFERYHNGNRYEERGKSFLFGLWRSFILGNKKIMKNVDAICIENGQCFLNLLVNWFNAKKNHVVIKVSSNIDRSCISIFP